MTSPSSPTRKLEDWFEAYKVYTYPMPSPEIFHKFTALSTVAGALRRKVWIDVPEIFRLYPNMYNVLIGPPGAMKGSAMRVGQRMLMELPGFDYSVDSVSREKLIQDLQQSLNMGDSALTVYSSEFSSMFSTSGPEMASFLTDIYESPDKWSHRTKSQTISIIVNAALNLQACTQPETMAKSLPIHSVGLGLTSRIVFVFADTPRERDWRPSKDPQQGMIRQLLINDLHVITTLNGEYTLEPEADEFYNQWYRPFMVAPHASTNDDRLRPYFSRKHTHVLKIAMALSAMRRDELVITLKELTDAFSILDEAEGVMGMSFSGFGAAVTATPMAKIMEILSARARPVAYGELLDLLKRDVRRQEFDECIETLLATNAIRKSDNGKLAYEIVK